MPKRKANPLRLEILEDRLVPATFIDMTELASQFPRHEGATDLWLNFDGFEDENVSPFVGVSGNVNRDIQDIIFKTQQIFAPFDVRVRQIFGEGNFDTSNHGDTTVFIGDHVMYGVGVNNGQGAFAPAAHSDFPGAALGTSHRPNSNLNDLAYVDPVFWSEGIASQSTLGIARSIAHEAGHTFGLAHVLTGGSSEMMSYDSANVRFADRTFGISDLNWDPEENQAVSTPSVVPRWRNEQGMELPLSLQNSFTYLKAVLGARSVGTDVANVADPSAVSGSYTDGPALVLKLDTPQSAGIGRFGDFDVFQFTPGYDMTLKIDVKHASGSTLDPVLLVYGSSGQNLLAYDDDSGAGYDSKVSLTLTKNTNYKIVVGGWGEQGTGAYVVTITNPNILKVVATPIYLTPIVMTASYTDVKSSGTSMLPTSIDYATPIVVDLRKLPAREEMPRKGVRPGNPPEPSALVRKHAATTWEDLTTSIFANSGVKAASW